MIIKQTLREVASKVFNFFVWFVLFCLRRPKLAELAVNTTGTSWFWCWLQEQAYLCIKYTGCQGLVAFILSHVWRLPVIATATANDFFSFSFFGFLRYLKTLTARLLSCHLQYFQGRLNTTEWHNGTMVEGEKYYFNNWMTLLSQLPLLLFTLLNSILYPRSVAGFLASCFYVHFEKIFLSLIHFITDM